MPTPLNKLESTLPMQQRPRTLFLAGALALCAVCAPAATHANWFKIVSLKTSHAVFADASLAGGLAASADHQFASRVGDSITLMA